MAWNYFTSVFVNLSGGIIVDMVDKTGFLLGLLITSLLLVILVLMKLKFLFIAVLAFLGFFLFSMRPVIFAWTMDLAPKDISGTVVSALFGIQSLFSSLAPAICGLIADRYGILSSFYFLSFTVFAANFLV